MNHGDGGESERLAPVTPLFGSRPRPAEEPGWHPTWVGDAPRASAPTAADSDDGWFTPDAEQDAPGRGMRASAAFEPGEPESEEPESEEDVAARAEKVLLRKLRTRSLSLREARTVLAGEGLRDDGADALIDRFVSFGYLDDRALAEHLIDKALSRKAQGRQAIAQTLTQRGIPREVADEALAELPDDETERALEFARSKAGQLRHLDYDTALRRLSGQLARRGFGAVALSAARQALTERTPGGSGGPGPRFR